MARAATAPAEVGEVDDLVARTKASRAVERTVALVGCGDAGRLFVRWVELAGYAGHGRARFGFLKITVELPDVATLPQNSPVKVDDVTVGSVSGIDAVQREDGTFYAAAHYRWTTTSSCPRTRRPGLRRPRCGFSTRRVGRPGRREGGRSAQGRLQIPVERTGRYPTTEEVLSSLGVVVNKGNLAALQDITEEVYTAVAGRTGRFTDWCPGWPN